MEKRLLLFFAITFVIVSLWARLFGPPPPVETPAELPAATPETGTASQAPRAEEATPLPREELLTERKAPPSESPGMGLLVGSESRPEAAAKAADRQRTITVETPLYRMALNNRGAVVESVLLTDYKGKNGDSYEIVGKTAKDTLNIFPLGLELDSPAMTELVTAALFDSEAPGQIVIAADDEKEVAFSWSDGRGLEVEKKLFFSGSSYAVEASISVRQRGEEVQKVVLSGAGIGEEVVESTYVGAEKGFVVSRGEVALFSAEDIREGEGGAISIKATGVASHYFAVLMVPRGEGSYGSRFRVNTVPMADDSGRKERDVITAGLEAPRDRAEFSIYLGPKKLEHLEALDQTFSEIIEFGSWMRHPALLLRTALMWIYGYVGNYGWAIMLLTVLINIVLIPLKHYSFVSMKRMQKIAPQTKKIRDRYKKVKPTDPRYQEMNKEIMALHKEHGVNPVSGCLPMLLMIPFFFAFYRLLMASVELRQAPFVLWVQDLSLHDPYFVLPILMGVTQLGIQRMTPQASADPIQAKIMSFMPVMFTFILAWAPSGLVLYWFSNNIVSMAQQIATNKLMKDPVPSGKVAGEKARKRKAKRST